MNALDKDELRFVRTQDDLYGMHVNADGDLILHRDERQFNRNTTHFSVNGAVGNHAYGTFDGQIAIIAKPSQMPTPSGFSQADVWFHNDKDGNLNAGKATIIAPIGTDLPLGVNAAFYDPELPGSRNDAVNKFLISENIEPKAIGMWSWVDSNVDSHYEWQIEKSLELYGEKAAKIQFCPHWDSVDDKIDSAMNACEGLLKVAKTQYLYEQNGYERESTKIVDEAIQTAIESLDKFKSVSSKEILSQASGYIEKLSEKISKCKEENEDIKKKYETPFKLSGSQFNQDETPMSLEQVENAIAERKIGSDCLISDIRFPEKGVIPIGEIFPEALSIPPVHPVKEADKSAMIPPPLPTSETVPELPKSGMMPPPLPNLDLLQSISLKSVGSAPPPPPFYLEQNDKNPEFTASLAARFNSTINESTTNPADRQKLKI